MEIGIWRKPSGQRRSPTDAHAFGWQFGKADVQAPKKVHSTRFLWIFQYILCDYSWGMSQRPHFILVCVLHIQIIGLVLEWVIATIVAVIDLFYFLIYINWLNFHLVLWLDRSRYVVVFLDASASWDDVRDIHAEVGSRYIMWSQHCEERSCSVECSASLDVNPSILNRYFHRKFIYFRVRWIEFILFGRMAEKT